jgi:LCP family protein required for cell wall assembly
MAYIPRRKRKQRSNIKKIFFVFFLLVVIGIFFTASKIKSFYEGIYTGKESVKNQIPTPKPEKKIFNFLIMGYGGGNHDGAYLTDTLMIAHVDMEKKRTVLISLPRDIWVKIPTKSGDDFHEKINAVYQMGLFNKNYPDIPAKYAEEQGAANLTKEVVGNIVGLEIDNYVAIDFEGFTKAVDVLGGVDVNVETTFDDYEYPVTGKEKDLCGKEEKDLPDLLKIATESPTLAFPCRYEHLHFDAGLTHMDGETALKYVRSRHSLQDGNDFGRAKRQQRFLEAVKNKVISIGFITKIPALMDEMQNYIRTDRYYTTPRIFSFS